MIKGTCCCTQLLCVTFMCAGDPNLCLSSVTSNLGCQVDYIWNQLKLKQLDMLVLDFLSWIIWSEKTLNLDDISSVSPHKRTWKKEAFGLYLLVLTHADELVYIVLEAFLCWCYNILPWDSYIDWKLATLLVFAGTPAPDWDCWDIQSHALNNY